MEDQLIERHKYKIRGMEIILSIEQVGYLFEKLQDEYDNLKQENELLKKELDNLDIIFDGLSKPRDLWYSDEIIEYIRHQMRKDN
jgi:cell division protein FtsB